MVREFLKDESFRRNFFQYKHFRHDVILLQGDEALGRMLHLNRQAGLCTLLDVPKLAMLRCAVRESLPCEGDLIEFGSYQGGSAGLIAQTICDSGKTLHLCDSFEGLPDPTEADNFHHRGDFEDTDADRVRCGLEKLGCGRFTHLHVGYFEETLPHIRVPRFCFAHIDVDLYQSVTECLEFVYPRMTPGGIILFDDYGAPTCLGAKQAVDDWFRDRPEKPQFLSGSAYGLQMGRTDRGLRRRLLRHAGWTSRLFYPVLHSTRLSRFSRL
jgi:O-methyltransferase